MKLISKYLVLIFLLCGISGCEKSTDLEATSNSTSPSAKEILGNPKYPAISYGGYREKTREQGPSVADLKEDMQILFAMGVRVLRTYNASQFPQAERILEAISQLKEANPSFEMYVMLGAWIDCKNAWSDTLEPVHDQESEENNRAEIEKTVELANQYPDIVKVIAVGNEAMVQWAVKYFVYPKTILRWVNYLQDLKQSGDLPADLWVTSSDNYESWGGGNKGYHTEDLVKLIKAVDFLSVHTYPFHDSHYNSEFWGVLEQEEQLSDVQMIERTMLRAKQYAISQYQGVVDYLQSLDIDKPIHIGETGWASIAATAYGATGSKAADQLKQAIFYKHMRDWGESSGMSVFYFEAFDEQWKDPHDINGSENHFGLISLDNKVKYALWDLFDQNAFDGLVRGGKPLSKSYQGNKSSLMQDVLLPPFKSKMGIRKLTTVNVDSVAGKPVDADTYVVVNPAMIPSATNNMTYPSNEIKLNPWEGTMDIHMSKDSVIKIATRSGDWWGGGLELQGDEGEDLSNFASGYLNFDIRGDASLAFNIGFQTGVFLAGTQVNNFQSFGPQADSQLTADWVSYKLPLAKIDKGADLTDVTGILYLWSSFSADKKRLEIKNIYYSKN
ncbi:MAG: glycosyl hydrolase family 17 protein [Porticoccaceae bacterium]